VPSRSLLLGRFCRRLGSLRQRSVRSARPTLDPSTVWSGPGTASAKSLQTGEAPDSRPTLPRRSLSARARWLSGPRPISARARFPPRPVFRAPARAFRPRSFPPALAHFRAGTTPSAPRRWRSWADRRFGRKSTVIASKRAISASIQPLSGSHCANTISASVPRYWSLTVPR
jgi:hypothetical protein